MTMRLEKHSGIIWLTDLTQLVSYFDYQAPNSTEVSDVYWKKVTSLATNTGGNCMFFQ